MSKIPTVALDNLIVNLNGMVQVIAEVLENGQVGTRAQRGVAALTEVITEIIELKSIVAEPVDYFRVSGISLMDGPDVGQIFGVETEQRLQKELGKLAREAVEKVTDLVEARAAVVGKLLEATGGGPVMNASQMELAYQVTALGSVENLLGVFFQMAKSANELIAVAAVHNFYQALNAHQVEPVICPAPLAQTTAAAPSDDQIGG